MPRSRGRELDWSLLRDISEDGRWVLFDESGEGASIAPSVYMRRMDGASAVRLGNGLAMEFSSDRKWALTMTPNHITLVPTGTGASRSYSLGPIQCHMAKWFPGDERILLAGNEPGGPLRAFALTLATGTIEPLSETAVQLEPFITPDSQHLVYPGPDQLYSYFPITGGHPRPIPGIQSNDRPARICKDGKSLFVYQRGQVPSRLERIDLETGHRELIRELVPPDVTGVMAIAPVRVTEDGSAYAYSFITLLHDLYVARGYL